MKVVSPVVFLSATPIAQTPRGSLTKTSTQDPFFLGKSRIRRQLAHSRPREGPMLGNFKSSKR